MSSSQQPQILHTLTLKQLQDLEAFNAEIEAIRQLRHQYCEGLVSMLVVPAGTVPHFNLQDRVIEAQPNDSASPPQLRLESADVTD